MRFTHIVEICLRIVRFAHLTSVMSKNSLLFSCLSGRGVVYWGMRNILVTLMLLYSSYGMAQCNQHVFSSVGAEQWTNFQYQDCDGFNHYFGIPDGGYTIILCADIGTAFVLNGDGFVYPLLTEHPSYPSCIQLPCPEDLDGDGVVGNGDLLLFLSKYGTSCEN